MKYFLLSFIALIIGVVGIFGFRGEKFGERPLRIFPDMDEQDYLRGQKPSPFFENGMGARLPVSETSPHAEDGGLFPLEFSEGRTGHYFTGAIDDYFATGMPKELKLDADNIEAFLRRGKERYAIFCAICHGESGNGQGVVSKYLNGVRSLHDAQFETGKYPNGKLYYVITNGQGLMGAYGSNIPVRDRWAIVAYIRALQEAQKAPAAVAEAEAPETPPAGDPNAPN